MENMTPLQIQVLETIITLVAYVLAFFITKFAINNTLKRVHVERTRRKIMIKIIHLLNMIPALIFLAGIWGLEQDEIAVFAGTLLTALGIAFFAQWSFLSNITSSLIIFFYHPMKLGDVLMIHDKDASMEGEIIELSYFFVYIKTKEGHTTTIPNSVLLQKIFSIREGAGPTS